MIADEEQARAYVAARCDSDAFLRIEQFVALLREENNRQNLVSAGSLEAVWRRHIADSAQLLDLIPDVSRGTWLDLGTGAGFPGLIISLMRPQFDVKLVESRRLRSDWLEHCVLQSALANCAVFSSKVEAVPQFPSDILSARAFAPLSKTVSLGRRFSTDDTVWLLPKGRSAAQEVESLPPRERKMFHVEQSVSDPEAGIVVGRMTERVSR